ncbi:hypothetical protein BPJM79_20503 [Bacillus pumilus]
MFIICYELSLYDVSTLCQAKIDKIFNLFESKDSKKLPNDIR